MEGDRDDSEGIAVVKTSSFAEASTVVKTSSFAEASADCLWLTASADCLWLIDYG